MKATNSLTTKKERKSFSTTIVGDTMQKMIRKSVPDPESAARFTATLISAVAENSQLRECDPATIVAAALRGEGMGLTLNREYHLLPFRNSCTFVISYRGLIALCLAGNDVADMDCVEVREGEYVGRDKRTKRPVFDFSVYETDEEAEQHPIIGYMAYCEMKSGYFRSEYMTIDEILRHADRYSRAFNIADYHKLQSGNLSKQEEERLLNGSPWYGNFETMCRKTVIRKLLNSGYIRLANNAAVKNAIAYDTDVEENDVPDLIVPQDTVIESTGFVVEPSAKETKEEPATLQIEPVDQTPSDADMEEAVIENFFAME